MAEAPKPTTKPPGPAAKPPAPAASAKAPAAAKPGSKNASPPKSQTFMIIAAVLLFGGLGWMVFNILTEPPEKPGPNEKKKH